MLEFKKERQRFFDQRNALNKVVRDMARRDENQEILERAIENGVLPKLTYTQNNVQPTEQDLLVSLNDLHFGACVDNYWNYYNSDVCRMMLQDYIGEDCLYCKFAWGRELLCMGKRRSHQWKYS